MLKNFVKKAIYSSLLLSVSLLASEVNVYSHRHYDTDKQLFKMFEEKTGIKVNVVKAKASALIKRIESEGERTPADVLITVDAGNLFQAKEKGLLQSISSPILEKNIPAHLIDNDKMWFALTKRSRVILVPKDKANELDIKTYEDLANPKYQGKIMIRSSNNIYNQSLLSAIIEHHGKDYALNWAKGVVRNMAKSPKGNDRYQVSAIANGIGEIAVANTYYIGQMATNEKEQKQINDVNKVKVIFPTFSDGATHINVSGAGVVKYSKNRDNAIKFIEFLTSKDAQELFAKANFEYPVLANVEISKLVSSWGTFTEDKISMSKLGENNKEAIKIFDKAGWK